MSIKFDSVALTATADLGTAHFSYIFKNASVPAVVNIQAYLHRTYTDANSVSYDEYKLVNVADSAGSTSINIYPGVDVTGSFSFSGLPLGKYTEARVIMFSGGSNFSSVVNDTTVLDIGLTIATSQIRVTAPVVEYDATKVVIDNAPDGKMHFPYTVKYPANYVWPGGYFWFMGKGSGGFAQSAISAADALTATGPDNYKYNTTELIVDKPTAGKGLYNLQFGLFDSAWKLLQWTYPGVTFEVGGSGWVVKCPADKLPPRLKVINYTWQTLDGKPFDFYANNSGSKAVKFVRGGNYGNALTWSDSPSLNNPNYFSLLKYAGLMWLRVLFNPDRYLVDTIYQDIVDQVVQNMLIAGVYPVLGPQNLPTGANTQDQLVSLMKLMATRYKGLPVWIDVCNEPSQLSTWKVCKPVMEAAVTAIRQIDPDALVISSFEGYCKSSTTDLAADPITSVHVDMYAYHAYNSPVEYAANVQPALKAGLPLFVEEYGGGDGAYLNSLDIAFQNSADAFPNIMGVGAWAYTVAGQDSIPLVLNGDTANITYTPSGSAVIKDIATWNSGNKIPTSVTPPVPTPPVPPVNPAPVALFTTEQINFITNLIVSKINARQNYIDSKLVSGLGTTPFTSISDIDNFLNKIVADFKV